MNKDEQADSVDKNIRMLTEKMKVEPVASFLKMRVIELKSGYAKVTCSSTCRKWSYLKIE